MEARSRCASLLLLPVGCCALLLGPHAAWGQQLSGLFQVDYVHGQESVDQLNDANGQPLNQNRVLIRRTRLKLSEEWRFIEFAAEGDFNTVAGPQVGARQLEVALVWPPHRDAPFPNLRFATARPPKVPAADAGPPPPKVPAADAGPPPPATAARGTEAGAAEPLDAGEAGAEGTVVDVAGAEASAADAGTPEVTATVANRAPAPAPSLLERFPLTVRLGAGIFRAPFGYDVYEQSHADRLFATPSLLAQAFFPGEFDLGARLSASWRGIGLTIAMQNGEPLGERSFPGLDPNTNKDFFGRVTVHADPARWLKLEVGASGMVGTGFHPGTPATKDVLTWRDLNEDGIAQLNEIQAIRGSAATPSENFDRWGVAGDLRARLQLPIGELTLFGEVALATNLDRGIRPADPVLLGGDQRSVAAFGGFTQEILERLLVGVRVDHYLAMIDQSRFEAGTLVRAQEPFTNFSFALAYCFGNSLPFGRGRILLDYTLRLDPLGRDAAGRPADLQNDLFTVRLQLEI